MPYPEVLLPSKLFKKISCDLSGYLVIRRTDSEDIINPSTGTLRDEAVVKDDIHLIDYSTNLVGCFEVEHLKYDIVGPRKNELTRYWDFSSEVIPPEEGTDFDVLFEYGYFTLPIEEFHDFRFPFKKGDNRDYQAVLLVVHKPTNCNYWHFEVRWHDFDKEGNPKEIKKNAKAKWQLALASTLKSMIKIHFERTIPVELTVLPESDYHR